MSCQYLCAIGVSCIIIFELWWLCHRPVLHLLCSLTHVSSFVPVLLLPGWHTGDLSLFSSSWCILSFCPQFDISFWSSAFDRPFLELASVNTTYFFILMFLPLCYTNVDGVFPLFKASGLLCHFVCCLCSSLPQTVQRRLHAHEFWERKGQLANAKRFSSIDSDTSFKLVHHSVVMLNSVIVTQDFQISSVLQ